MDNAGCLEYCDSCALQAHSADEHKNQLVRNFESKQDIPDYIRPQFPLASQWREMEIQMISPTS